MHPLPALLAAGHQSGQQERMDPPERTLLLLATLLFSCSLTRSFSGSRCHKISFLAYLKLDGMDSPSVTYTRELTTRNVFVERTLEPSFVFLLHYRRGQE